MPPTTYLCPGCGVPVARWCCQPCWELLPKPLRLTINGPYFQDNVQYDLVRQAISQALAIWRSNLPALALVGAA